MAIDLTWLLAGPLMQVIALFQGVLLWLLVPVKHVPKAAARRPSELTATEAGAVGAHPQGPHGGREPR